MENKVNNSPDSPNINDIISSIKSSMIDNDGLIYDIRYKINFIKKFKEVTKENDVLKTTEPDDVMDHLFEIINRLKNTKYVLNDILNHLNTII